MAKNIQEVKIGGSGKMNVAISGLTNAAYIQRVVVSSSIQGFQPQTFEGSGEGVYFGNSIQLKDVELPVSFVLDFSYSSDGGTKFSPAKRSQQEKSSPYPHVDVYKVQGEDATDNDYDDTIMYVCVQRTA